MDEATKTVVIKLRAESCELMEKIWKLGDFININPKFLELDNKQRRLLRRQHQVMIDYYNILGLRIKLLLGEEVSDLQMRALEA